MKRRVFSLLFLVSSFAAYAQVNIPLQNEILEKGFENREYDIILEGEEVEILALLTEKKIKLKYQSKHFFAIHLSGAQLNEIVNYPCISKLHFDNSKGKLLNDKMIVNANVSGLQEVGIHGNILNGEDVLIGFIDSGVDYTHPDLINEDGTSRIVYIWDQKAPIDSSEIFEDYGYGKLISNDTLNQWLDSSIQIVMDPNNWYGHGTTVVGTACSNGRALESLVEAGAIDYDLHGVAPKSSIIMVASDFSGTNWLASVADGVHFMLSKAEELNKAIVINLSIGTYSGSHDALDPVGSMINDWFTDDYTGRMAVCAGGNSRTLRYHLGYESSLDTNYSIYSTFLSPFDIGRTSFVELWLDSMDIETFQSKVALFNSSTGEIMSFQSGFSSIEDNLDSTLIDTLFVSDTSVVAIVRKFMQSRGDQIQFQIQVDHIVNSNYKMVLYTTGEARVDGWAAQWLGSSDIIGPEALPNDIINDPMYVSPDSLIQIVSSFSCAQNVLTVANFKNRIEYTDVNGNIQNLGGQSGELALHSSRGPTRDGRIKPDVSASGELILSAGPFNYMSILLSAAPYKVAEGGWHMRNGGTSMASPIVAGIAALYLQRCPYTVPSVIRQAICQSAYQDIFTGTLPNTSWGNGKVDGLGAINQSLEEIEIIENAELCTDSLINLNVIGDYTSLNWNTGDSSSSICVNEGEYWVYGNDLNGCLQRSSTILVLPDDIVEYNTTDLLIYPNPSKGTFTIKGIENKSTIRIVNILGQDQEFGLLKMEDYWILELLNVKVGIYFLLDEDKGTYSELIITN